MQLRVQSKQLSVGGSLPEHWMNDRRKANPLQQKRAPCHGYFYQVSGQSYHSRTTPQQTDVVSDSRANQGAKAAGYRQYGWENRRSEIFHLSSSIGTPSLRVDTLAQWKNKMKRIQSCTVLLLVNIAELHIWSVLTETRTRSKIKLSHFVVFGALIRMVLVRGASEQPFWDIPISKITKYGKAYSWAGDDVIETKWKVDRKIEDEFVFSSFFESLQ